MLKDNITISIPVISTKRYTNIQAVKIKGMTQINTYLDALLWNNIKYIRENSFNENPLTNEKTNIFTIKDLDKTQGVELIQLNYLNEPDSSVSAIFTLGIILMKDINDINKEINH